MTGRGDDRHRGCGRAIEMFQQGEGEKFVWKKRRERREEKPELQTEAVSGEGCEGGGGGAHLRA